MRTSIDLENNSINLNRRLIERQGLDQSEVDSILRLHVIKHKVFYKMNALNPATERATLRFLAQTVRQIEFAMQKEWKFDQNENMHRWFEVPHCSCPKIDNSDNLGTTYQTINTNCPVHGKDV